MIPGSLRRRLRHVYWVGGAPAAGKSTVARRLADRYGFALYATDDVMPEHAGRSTAADAPNLERFKAMDMDERWVNRSPETMLETFHWFRGEGFHLIVEDLLNFPTGTGIIAEGFRLLPHLVVPLLDDRNHAVWLLPTPAFRQAALKSRGSLWDIPTRTSNPERARANLIERDRMFADRLAIEAERLNCATIQLAIDMTEADTTDRVSRLFGLPTPTANRSLRSFTDLVDEAAAADVSGWDFDWLDGRATEERPPWNYSRTIAARLPLARAALDIDTGGGEVIAGVPELPARMCVTESWPPNLERARRLLSPRGVEVVQSGEGDPLPFPDASFDLVISRHPVRPDWPEIARVLCDGGTYLAQHVGPASAFELIEYFLGPLPEQRKSRDPQAAATAAEAAGLTVVDLRTARCRMEFFDIGAVVYILRKCVWWVPDFTVDRYHDTLKRLDDQIRRDGAFVAHSTRYLIEARRSAGRRGR